MIQEKARELLRAAVAAGASDLYFQPLDTTYAIYFREQERQLKERVALEVGQALLAHFKFCAGMNVGERRRTQLGACWYELEPQQSIRLRLSSVGDFEGRESLVIRLLHNEQKLLDFWFTEDMQDLWRMPFTRGLYLFSGPVGSGKTSLMFALAKQKFAQQQVLTIEDPVELVAGEFVQLQVNEAIGNDYDSLIKLSLRHRPDLLIVGEIRDAKTARAVLQASLTGYTVFSTVHAKSIAGVWARLLELGLTQQELKNSLQAVFYQRLIHQKGLVEVARHDFSSTQMANWNAKIDRLLAAGFIGPDTAAREKIADQAANQADSADAQPA